MVTVKDLLQLMPREENCCIFSESASFSADTTEAGELLLTLEDGILSSPVIEFRRSVFNRIMITID